MYENSYKWYVDEKLIQGQFGFYFKISNVTRNYHDKQVMCRVENELGTASGIRTIEVKCKFANLLFIISRANSVDCFRLSASKSDLDGLALNYS